MSLHTLQETLGRNIFTAAELDATTYASPYSSVQHQQQLRPLRSALMLARDDAFDLARQFDALCRSLDDEARRLGLQPEVGRREEVPARGPWVFCRELDKLVGVAAELRDRVRRLAGADGEGAGTDAGAGAGTGEGKTAAAAAVAPRGSDATSPCVKSNAAVCPRSPRGSGGDGGSSSGSGNVLSGRAAERMETDPQAVRESMESSSSSSEAVSSISP